MLPAPPMAWVKRKERSVIAVSGQGCPLIAWRHSGVEGARTAHSVDVVSVSGVPTTAPAGRWWATLESNQAWVSPAELQSAAAPCSISPTEGVITEALRGRQGENRKKVKRDFCLPVRAG